MTADLNQIPKTASLPDSLVQSQLPYIALSNGFEEDADVSTAKAAINPGRGRMRADTLEEFKQDELEENYNT